MPLGPHVGLLQHLARFRTDLAQPNVLARVELVGVDAALIANGIATIPAGVEFAKQLRLIVAEDATLFAVAASLPFDLV